MSNDDSNKSAADEPNVPTTAEDQQPLIPPPMNDVVRSVIQSSTPDSTSSPYSYQKKRHSSLSIQPPDGQPKTPRTANRVRFDLEEIDSNSDSDAISPRTPNGRARRGDKDAGWVDEDDYFASSSNGVVGLGLTGADAPLLPDGDGPRESMTLEEEFRPEDYLESARPKSNLRAAFMNMANSIIGAGIIGQPYAFRQAGLATGIILMVGLTFVVDWTIRLIVINTKLSGAATFQSTVEFCFGKPGLIAITLAQWLFAFGGMIAFCVIIGDTIPHVLSAVFPGLEEMPFVWLLTNRRAVILFFVLGISWPLSLYRDIAKARSSPGPSFLLCTRLTYQHSYLKLQHWRY